MRLSPLLIAGLVSIAAIAIALPSWSELKSDPAHGQKIYERCLACHAIDRDRTGPRHAGLFGRKAGGVEGYSYSAAMKAAGNKGLVWTEDTLDKFLKSPTTFVPGTKMGYAGVKDDQERADLIAYLKDATKE